MRVVVERVAGEGRERDRDAVVMLRERAEAETTDYK